MDRWHLHARAPRPSVNPSLLSGILYQDSKRGSVPPAEVGLKVSFRRCQSNKGGVSTCRNFWFQFTFYTSPPPLFYNLLMCSLTTLWTSKTSNHPLTVIISYTGEASVLLKEKMIFLCCNCRNVIRWYNVLL